MSRESTESRGEVELLAVRCQLGEASAFEELVDRWHQPMWGYVWRLAQNDEAAREILQDTWLRIVRGIDGLRQPASLVSWMFRIARFVAMDRLRLRYTQLETSGADLDLMEAEPETGLEADDLEELERGLSSLPAADREVLTLFYLQELSLREVAEILEIPVGTVKSRLFRARGALRREMLGIKAVEVAVG